MTDPSPELTPFAVHVDPESLEWTASGTFVGKIWVALGDTAFPEAGWFDFTVVILSWWIDKLVGLADGGRTGAFRFMDGPYQVDFAAGGDGVLETALARTGTRYGVLATAFVAIDAVARELDAAADAVLRSCAERRWRAPDIENLKLAHGRLRAILDHPAA